MMENKKKKTLIAVIPENLHRDIKTRASIMNMTIKQYIIQSVMEKIQRERQYER
jgi:hypothetical protein